MNIPTRTITTVLAAAAVVFGGVAPLAFAASVPEITCTASSVYTVTTDNADAYSQTVPKLHCFSSYDNYLKYMTGKNLLATVFSGVNDSGRKLSILGPTCTEDTSNSGMTHMPYGWNLKSQSIKVIDRTCVPNYYPETDYNGAAQGCLVACSPIIHMDSFDDPAAGF